VVEVAADVVAKQEIDPYTFNATSNGHATLTSGTACCSAQNVQLHQRLNNWRVICDLMNKYVVFW